MTIPKFWIITGFLEICTWVVLVPYLVWQQWSGYVAAGLIVWWSVGYFRLFIKGFREYRRITKGLRALVRHEAAVGDEIDKQFPAEFSDN
jgi:hypothetical protein